MGRLALTHQGRTRILPPVELLEPYIERTDHHWYWLGEFYDDKLDRSAEFRWAPPAEKTAVFMVPRLLWQLAHPDTPARLIENTCGLFTCINPSHWRKRGPGVVIPARIVLPEHVLAMPMVSQSNNLVVHIRRLDTPHVVCGASGKHMDGGGKKTVVTCDDCISAWVRTGQPYTEVT